MKKNVKNQLSRKYLKLNIHTIGTFDSKVNNRLNNKRLTTNDDTVPTLITSTLF